MPNEPELVTNLINRLIAENRRTATTESSKKDQSKEIENIFTESFKMLQPNNED
tara:strand:- start:531 stop:692 length:162 start_codon:yes stop_codon:yes gene_type:complete